MPYNGSGTFSLVAGNPVVTGTTISSTVHNNTMSDIANNGLTLALTKDGQQTPTGNLPMGGFRHTGVANGVARTDYAALGQAQDSGARDLTNVTGTDTITATLSPAITAYVKGQTFNLVPAGNNTGTSVTININGVGAKSITKNGTLALAPNDLVTGVASQIYYDGTQFQLLTVPGTQPAIVNSIVRNLSAQNGASPNTQMSMSAASVTFKGATGQSMLTRFNVGTVTNDISVGGPAANARDQAGAFGTTATVHLYFIWNGTTVATLSSAQPPTIGPTMPSGYTHWAYAMTTVLNGTNFHVIRAYGKRVFYVNPPSLGTPNATTSGSYAPFVPQIAESWSWRGSFGMNSDAAGGAYATLGIDSGLTNQPVLQYGLTGLAPTAATGPIQGRWTDMPNVPGQIISFVISVAVGGSPATTNFVTDYIVPNC